MKRLLPLVLLAVHAPAFAASDALTWSAPVVCTDNSPAATNCPATGFLIETANTPTATVWTAVTTTLPSATTFSVTGVSIGQHCYRITTVSAGGNSVPSGAVCKTDVAPLPNPPTGVTVAVTAPTAYKMRDAVNGYSMVAFGTVPIGTPCDCSHIADGLCLIDRNAVKMASALDTKPIKAFANCA
jgi:hypothetical protein